MDGKKKYRRRLGIVVIFRIDQENGVAASGRVVRDDDRRFADDFCSPPTRIAVAVRLEGLGRRPNHIFVVQSITPVPPPPCSTHVQKDRRKFRCRADL